MELEKKLSSILFISENHHHHHHHYHHSSSSRNRRKERGPVVIEDRILLYLYISLQRLKPPIDQFYPNLSRNVPSDKSPASLSPEQHRQAKEYDCTREDAYHDCSRISTGRLFTARGEICDWGWRMKSGRTSVNRSIKRWNIDLFSI